MSPRRPNVPKRLAGLAVLIVVLGKTQVQTAVAQPPPPANSFRVQSYDGAKKCLDYGALPQPRGLAAPPTLFRRGLAVLEGLLKAWGLFMPPAAASVFLNDCERANAIVVQEINGRHEVILHAGNSVIGIHNPPINTLGGPPARPQTEYALELQRYNPILATTSNQVWALDGDSIILARSRACITTDPANPCPPPPPLPLPPLSGQVVIQVQNARGSNGSPLVAGVRNLADSEFWDFNAIDGSDKDPTNGFVRAGYPGDPATAYDTLLSLLRPLDGSYCQNASSVCQPSPAGPGTVIKIYPGADINLTGLSQLQIPAGVTIRGNRRGTLPGPLLHWDSAPPDVTSTMLEIFGDEVRITGLRLQGQSDGGEESQPHSRGLLVHDDQYIHSIVDHNDISQWTNVGVVVNGSDTLEMNSACDANNVEAQDPTARPHKTFVVRNFIHHNQRQEGGYGVEAYFGGYPLVEGNTFVSNRHAIASGYGSAHSGYRARLNLVLSTAPLQHPELCIVNACFYTHDFDMHGLLDNGFGGLGGDYVEIHGNTFFGTNRHNYELRGLPCNDSHFDYNVSLQKADQAVNFNLCPNVCSSGDGPTPIAISGNQFQVTDPTARLGVGDFDGDHVDDLFLATGAAWYYSPGGKAEWRFLSAKTDGIDQLLFGDFDGDGRTDVITIHGGQIVVSWGGISDWEVLNSTIFWVTPSAISDLAVGDFDVKGRADLFWANGTNWYISSGGSGPFTLANTSSFRVKDLRFGDFDGDGRTDVFGVVSNGVINTWSYSKSARGPWSEGYLRPALTNTVDQLVVADFDGDGRADVATINPNLATTPFNNWLISYNGVGDWKEYIVVAANLCFSPDPALVPLPLMPAIGFFAGNRGADVLLWNGGIASPIPPILCIAPGGNVPGQVGWTAGLESYSRQDMR